MPDLNVSNVLAGLAVADSERSIDWFTAVLGRGPDNRPMPSLADWNFDGGHTLQLYADLNRAGGSMVTLNVDDIEVAKANVVSRGVEMTTDAPIPGVAVASGMVAGHRRVVRGS